jgi:hypothetical protein
MDEYDYFMIRIRRPAADALGQPLSGVLERLATGEKKGFESDAELLRLVRPEPGVEVNVGAGPESGNR